ncbi:hypothetical protein KAFR_0B03210 [Kazachstania africana CBS 2517]|uniref:Protein DML1 n=1 Tax=Kazachstania africana (strain ATCC 22294 / BCRC 22015 / CBS 2517 / CECT 1963 / NBRC 1671 / NRRL Y-8276) TaxID=1071382 RepID=H2AQG7_KAZAF|nr:hypothetical protein KAFR_0B03210 [Kazachstania africana CBS 2517]CCF56617.1 hypothetical protein KAFR_0B03210 [Kazachstania africana CBS 2517]
MQEIITIATSHRANHLATQFFNCQEQYLYEQELDPTIFLNPTIDKISKTASYAPRALLWEARSGSGSLGIYEYTASTQDHHFSNPNDNYDNSELIFTMPRIKKSEYQVAIDSSATPPKLNTSNTNYWSDYNKLIYDTSSLNFLKDWNHDVNEPNLPYLHNLPEKQYKEMELGIQAFDSSKDEFFDNQLRVQLENCDYLQGFNLLTDLDNGWSGFSTSLLRELRDEVPKKFVFSWSLNEDDFYSGTKKDCKNKIKGTVALADDSDLVLPLFTDSAKLSNWEVGGQLCKIFDSVNSLFSVRGSQKRKNMSYLVDLLTDNDEKRNVVSSMLNLDEGIDYSFCSRIQSYQVKNGYEPHIFNYCQISRHDESELADKEKPVNATSKYKKLKELNTIPYNPSDTIPEQYAVKKKFSVKLSMTEKNRDMFKNWSNYVSKYFRFDDDREELKNELNDKAAAYEFGCYSDEDSGDDDL